MNVPDSETLKLANTEAIYTLYTYLARKTVPIQYESLASIVTDLVSAFQKHKPRPWKERDRYRLYILQNAVNENPFLAQSRIVDLTRSRNGLTACSFAKPNGEFSVVFRGTGKGEWIDNGEGLSGVPEKNTYVIYGKNGKPLFHKTIVQDYATDQQVQALNWFRYIASKHNWAAPATITLSGHSKGGNKAQFVTMHSDLIKVCYSFDGQGFSPEALTALKKRSGSAYDERRQRIYSFSADNDYVNVLGKRLIPEQNLYFLESTKGFHYLEAMLYDDGRFHPPCEQGRLSRYIETVSDELMDMPPSIREYATLGIMNLFQKYLGKGIPVNGDSVSVEQTIAGIGLTLGPLLSNLNHDNP